ncbi:MFS transporter [Stackebrandtia soli]|uniref:MFS transporter n=1 Tax=Stackebrandtia soli TaxID=1892856 RepID=UPI0039E8DD76
MTVGLVVSIIGTRIIEGGSNGTVAAGILPVVWIAVLATVGQALTFAAPLFARVFSRYNPANVLIASDATEALMSLLALGALLLYPSAAAPILIAYLLVASVFPAASDIVEEFYAQQLAQLDSEHALRFNTAIYSIMAFIGLVIGMPLGSVVAGYSISWLIGVNMVLSAGGTVFRLVSARTLVAKPVADQDVEDFGALGKKTTLREFAADLVRTGPASPAVSFITQLGAVMGGIYVYLWIAGSTGWPATTALGTVIAVFGVGATIGPHAAPLLRRRLSIENALLVAYVSAVGILTLAILGITFLPTPANWIAGLTYVLLIAITSRVRSVLTTTLRQQSFRGRRFSTVMSWSMALTALADVMGNWTSVILGVILVPQIGLGVYLLAMLAAIAVLSRRRRPQVDSDDERLGSGC